MAAFNRPYCALEISSVHQWGSSVSIRHFLGYTLLLILLSTTINMLPASVFGLGDDVTGEYQLKILRSLLSLFIFSLVIALGSWWASTAAKRRANELLDGDDALVAKIVKAVRPPAALSAANNTFWFIAGAIASAYGDDIRALIDGVLR